MAAITSALIAIGGVVLGWIAIEIACKPCLEKGRQAIDQSLNPDYDPDDVVPTAPLLNPNSNSNAAAAAADPSDSSTAIKTV